MRCRLILSISEHPIQQGIRIEGGSPERDGGEEGLVLAYSSSWMSRKQNAFVYVAKTILLDL